MFAIVEYEKAQVLFLGHRVRRYLPRCGSGRRSPSQQASSLTAFSTSGRSSSPPIDASHGAFSRSVDFQNLVGAEAAEVNGFIAQATKGRLTNRHQVPPRQRHTLQGDVARAFKSSNTVHRTFHLLDSTTALVPFLSDPGRHFVASFDIDGVAFKVLQLFYKSDDDQVDSGAPRFCMLRDQKGLRDILRMAVTEPGFVTRCMPRTTQTVSRCMVPKFKFSYRFDAGAALAQLGFGALFDPLTTDLSRMAVNREHAAREALRCEVEVDEEGTMAVEGIPGYSPRFRPPKPLNFQAEHPFMFAIVEYQQNWSNPTLEYGNAKVLFLGHVMDPSN
uniref:Serpin domain-containing protein n=1 Tax=Leersia perrieri TaxID=77586 RepID=A0A0D9W7J3_9ORYZ